MEAKQTIRCVRVDLRLNERTGKFNPGNSIGQIKEFGRQITAVKGWKKQLGKNGYMTVEDYEAGLFAEYGIDGKKIQEAKKVENLQAVNSELQAKIAELEAQLSTGKKNKKEVDNGTN